jgi:hypothetical protein
MGKLFQAETSMTVIHICHSCKKQVGKNSVTIASGNTWHYCDHCEEQIKQDADAIDQMLNGFEEWRSKLTQ